MSELSDGYERWLTNFLPEENASGFVKPQTFTFVYERMLRGDGRHETVTDQFISDGLKRILKQERGFAAQVMVSDFVKQFLNGPRIRAVN